MTWQIWDEIDPDDVVGKDSKNPVLLINQLWGCLKILWYESIYLLLSWAQFRLDFMLVEAKNTSTETNVGTQKWEGCMGKLNIYGAQKCENKKIQ